MSDTDNTTTTIETSSYQGGTSDIDAAVNDFIKNEAGKFQVALEHEELATELEKTPEQVAAEVAPPEETVTPPPGVPEAPKAPDKAEERGLERLVEREVALRARETELAVRESRYQELETKMKALEARALPEDLAAKFEYAPEEALKAMGVDPDALVRQVIANRLGDSADPSVKDTIEKAKINRQINELRAQLSEQQRAAKAQAFVAQVEAGARQYLGKELSENDAPTVAAVAKANPERVFREIMEEISQDANAKMSSGRGGDVLTYTEAAKRVEARWSEFRTMFTPPAQTTTAPANPAASTTAPAATVQGAKKTPPVIKPPDRPIAPWLQRADIDEAGVKAGMAEYLRSINKGQ